MKNIKKCKPLTITIIVFIIMTLLSTTVVCFFARDRKTLAIDKAYYIAESQVSELERALSSYTQVTDTLRVLLVDNNGVINDFDRVAAELYHNDAAFGSIQLAPQGDVQYVYPLAGNEEVFGSIFDDPERREDAEYAKETGKTTLAGPFELYQGGFGIVVRQPIYLEHENEKEFWGFSIVVLNVPEIFDSAHLDTLKNMGYAYELTHINSVSNEKQIIIKSDDKEIKDPVEISFDVPGNTWTFGIAVDGGWLDSDIIWPIAISFFCITVLLSFLCYFLLRIKEVSLHDYLTKLYNGRRMNEVILDYFHRKTPFTVIYLDVDKFKLVNDTYGHSVGDNLLIELANHITSILSKNDTAYRIGGDEFAILLEGNRVPNIVMKELLQKLESPFYIDSQSYYILISYGWASYPDDTQITGDLVKIADQKMYEMKYKKQHHQ